MWMKSDELTEFEKGKARDMIKGMTADMLLEAVKVIPTTVIAQELERRNEEVSAKLNNISALVKTVTRYTSIDDCYKTIDAIRAIVR